MTAAVNLLLVTGNPTMANVYERQLKSLSYSVLVTRSLADARIKLTLKAPEAVILDLDFTDAAVQAEVRELTASRPDLPFVLICPPDDGPRFLQATGARGYAARPPRPERVKAAVDLAILADIEQMLATMAEQETDREWILLEAGAEPGGAWSELEARVAATLGEAGRLAVGVEVMLRHLPAPVPAGKPGREHGLAGFRRLIKEQATRLPSPAGVKSLDRDRFRLLFAAKDLAGATRVVEDWRRALATFATERLSGGRDPAADAAGGPVTVVMVVRTVTASARIAALDQDLPDLKAEEPASSAGRIIWLDEAEFLEAVAK